MRGSVVVKEAAPFFGRLATAFVELTLATAVIVGAVVVGHNLREWRDFYPTAHHPWLESEQPATGVSEP
jgi:hypothetical protein